MLKVIETLVTQTLNCVRYKNKDFRFLKTEALNFINVEYT